MSEARKAQPRLRKRSACNHSPSLLQRLSPRALKCFELVPLMAVSCGPEAAPGLRIESRLTAIAAINRVAPALHGAMKTNGGKRSARHAPLHQSL